jgi:hypothetical protein
MLPTPPGKRLHLNHAHLQKYLLDLGLRQRAARVCPQLSAVIGGNIG